MYGEYLTRCRLISTSTSLGTVWFEAETTIYGGSISMSQSLLGSIELPLDWEVVDEYEEERECPWKGRLSGVLFSRPREAMSSTKDGRVVMVASRVPEARVTVCAPTLL
jgi:hypothetical protein